MFEYEYKLKQRAKDCNKAHVHLQSPQKKKESVSLLAPYFVDCRLEKDELESKER
jgi:hypothetical protein